MKNKCYKCWWVDKYGIDFLRHSGLVTMESIARFLNVDIRNFRYDNTYKNLRKLLKENDL